MAGAAAGHRRLGGSLAGIRKGTFASIRCAGLGDLGARCDRQRGADAANTITPAPLPTAGVAEAIDNSEELPTAIADQQAEFEAARRGGQLQVGHAIAHQPANWDDRVANHHVEAHEQPVSRESVGSVLGPNMARASTDQLMRSLQASEQSKDELADEMRTSAAAAGAQRAKEQEASAQKQTLVSQRALIAARGVAASMRLSITSKVDALELEHDTTASMIADSTMPNRDTDIRIEESTPGCEGRCRSCHY